MPTTILMVMVGVLCFSSLLEASPDNPKVKVNAIWARGIQLYGYDYAPENPMRGEKVTVSFYWRKLDNQITYSYAENSIYTICDFFSDSSFGSINVYCLNPVTPDQGIWKQGETHTFTHEFHAGGAPQTKTQSVGAAVRRERFSSEPYAYLPIIAGAPERYGDDEIYLYLLCSGKRCRWVHF